MYVGTAYARLAAFVVVFVLNTTGTGEPVELSTTPVLAPAFSLPPPPLPFA
jgi:hypothetical protein